MTNSRVYADSDTIWGHDEYGQHVHSFEIEGGHTLPKGRWYHAAFHSICAVVGAGVLGLPYAFSYLGWVAGMIYLSSYCIFAIYTSDLLSKLHEGASLGHRLNTYGEIAEAVLGRRWANAIVNPSQYALLVGLCLTYSVTAGQSLKGVVSSDCEGRECQSGLTGWIALFGVLQLLLSLVRDIHALWWVSLLGSVMSIGYVLIAVVAAAIDAARGTARHSEPRIESTARTIFGTFNALGTVAFTFGGQAVLPEVQATLAQPALGETTLPSMRGALAVSFGIVIAAYYAVSVSGYLAYGSSASSDVLLDIQTSKEVRQAANLMVVLHVAAAFQVFAQPVFAAIESSIARRLMRPSIGLAGRIGIRYTYVIVCVLIAMVFPFFEELMGVISSIGLIPISFTIPCVMWLVSARPKGFSWAFNWLIIVTSTIVSALSLVGSLRNIIINLKDG